MRIIDRSRHKLRRFAAGITKHNALVARALVLIACRINTLCNINRLRMKQNFNISAFPMEAVLLIANVADRLTSQVNDRVFREDGTAHFACNHNAIGRRQRLASHTNVIRVDAGFCAFTEKQVDHFIRDAIADLVRMTFRN